MLGFLFSKKIELLIFSTLVNEFWQSNRRTIMDDPFIRNYIEDLLKNIRTQVLLKLIKPYTRIRIPFISQVSFYSVACPWNSLWKKGKWITHFYWLVFTLPYHINLKQKFFAPAKAVGLISICYFGYQNMLNKLRCLSTVLNGINY